MTEDEWETVARVVGASYLLGFNCHHFKITEKAIRLSETLKFHFVVQQ